MNLNQELSERLFTMMNLMHALRCGGRPEGRGYAQDRALRAIASQEGVTQRALMEALDVRPSSISELLTKLENGGLIERRPNPDDRRQMRLYLSDSGRAQAAQLGEDAPLPDPFEALTDEERQQYLALTDRMIDALTRACEERGIPADRSFGHGGPRPFGHGPGRGGRGFHAEDEGRGFDGHPHRDGRDFDGNGGRRGGRSFDSNRGAENGRGRNSRNEPAGAPSAASDSICDGCGKGCKLTHPDCGHGARLARERGISTRNGSGR